MASHHSSPAASNAAAAASSAATITRFLIADENRFDAEIAEIASKRPAAVALFVYVIGASDAESKLSWCGDSRAADPILEQTLKSLNRSAFLVEAHVQRDTYRNNPEHIFRKHPQLKLKSIPSIYAWKNGRSQGVLSDLTNGAMLSDFMLTIMNRTVVAAAVAADSFSDESSKKIHLEDIAVEEEFERRMADIEAGNEAKLPIFLLVLGDRDYCSLQSWCPDCVVADPIIHAALKTLPEGAILVEAPVKRATYKGNPNHPYRLHDQLKMKAIPTMFRWRGGQTHGALVEGDLFNLETVKAFVAKEF